MVRLSHKKTCCLLSYIILMVAVFIGGGHVSSDEAYYVICLGSDVEYVFVRSSAIWNPQLLQDT